MKTIKLDNFEIAGNKLTILAGPCAMETEEISFQTAKKLKEICNHLGVSRDTLLTWIADKGLPAHKVGRNWKFKPSEVDEWVKTGKASV